MATKGSSKLYTISDLWSGLEDIRDQVNQQSIRLFRILQVDSSNLLSPLVLELLKYYNCDLNTFIFNGHSFAITLEDILYITGLPIQGIQIMDTSKDKNAFSIFDATNRKSSYPIRKLKDYAKDTRVDPIRRMKAALLVLIACFVIPTGDKHEINQNFVKYVDKLDEVDNYAWGATLLDFLHKGIIKWKKEENKKSLINGNLWVVLSVFLIRIRSLREAIHIKLDLENAEVPLLHSVVNAVKNISHNHKPKYLDKVKEALDTLSKEEINWVPYKHLQLRLPGILKEQEKYKLWGLSRHNEETSMSRDADAFRKMSLDTNMQIIHSPHQSIRYKVRREREMNCENLVVIDTSNSSNADEAGREEELHAEKLMVEDHPINLCVSAEGGREEEYQSEKLIMEEITDLSIADEVGRKEVLHDEKLMVEDHPKNLCISEEGGREEEYHAEKLIREDITNLSIADEVGREQELNAQNLIVDDTPPKLSFHEDDLTKKNIMLEEENIELEKKIDQLVEENGLLRRQNVSYTQLDEQHDKLKQELESAREENRILRLSIDTYVDGMERHIMDFETNTTK